MAGSQPSTPGGGKRIETGVDPRLFVSLRLNGKGVRALVDTGAARTLMDLALWKSIYEDTRPPYCRSTVQLQGITGQQIDTVGLVDVSVCGRIIPVYLVRTIDPTMFILGYDSLCILDATIDAASNHVTINGEGYQPILGHAEAHVLTWEQYWGKEFPDVFTPTSAIGCNSAVAMNIRLSDHTPVRKAPYRAPLHKRREIENQVQDLLARGIIRPSTSPWASPVTLVPKKDGGTRMCVDYRQLNSQTQMDAYPLPRIQDVFDQLAGSTTYSLIDMKAGFHQIPMHPDSIPYTAFSTHVGLFEYVRMPFGLKTAPGVFQRAMNDTLRPLLGRCVMPYLDDVCIYSPTPEQHRIDVRNVLDLLARKGFTAKASKCRLHLDKIDLLGFSIDRHGVRPQAEKVRVITEMSAPTDITALRRFLGMIGYHRSMIPSYSDHSSVLTDLTRKGVPWIWERKHQDAFEYLRDFMTSDTIMQGYPDLNSPFEVYTDASNVAVGAILIQRDARGHPRPIQYISSTLNNTQRRWPAIEKEAYAIVYALKTLRPYLYGAIFQVFTDHKPLKAMFIGEICNTKVQRWAMFISEHGAPINFVKGKYNLKADFLSRLERPLDVEDTWLPMVDMAAVQVTDAYYLQRLRVDGAEVDRFLADQRTELPDWDTDDELIDADGVLCTTRAPRNGECYPRIWVPDGHRMPLIGSYHQSTGHSGPAIMQRLLQRDYKWPGMWTDIRTYYSRCNLCSVHRERCDKPPPTEMLQARLPNEVVAMDMVGPLPHSTKGRRYILTVMDHATCWVEAYPLESKSARAVTEAFNGEWVSRYGAPAIVLTDQGSEFNNSELRQYFQDLGIQHRRSTPYHPQTNGKLERAHRTIKNILRKLSNAHDGDWEGSLAAAMWAYRVTPKPNGFTPFFLQFGRDPDIPDVAITPEHNAMTRWRTLRVSFSEAYERARQSRQFDQARLTRQATGIELRSGDTVVLYNNVRGVFDPRWDHLYTVTRVRGPVISLEDQHGHRRIVNRSHVRLAPVNGWDDISRRVRRANRARVQDRRQHVPLPSISQPASNPDVGPAVPAPGPSTSMDTDPARATKRSLLNSSEDVRAQGSPPKRPRHADMISLVGAIVYQHHVRLHSPFWPGQCSHLPPTSAARRSRRRDRC